MALCTHHGIVTLEATADSWPHVCLLSRWCVEPGPRPGAMAWHFPGALGTAGDLLLPAHLAMGTSPVLLEPSMSQRHQGTTRSQAGRWPRGLPAPADGDRGLILTQHLFSKAQRPASMFPLSKWAQHPLTQALGPTEGQTDWQPHLGQECSMNSG